MIFLKFIYLKANCDKYYQKSLGFWQLYNSGALCIHTVLMMALQYFLLKFMFIKNSSKHSIIGEQHMKG